MYKLAVILSHPVQYYSPLFVELAKQQDLKVFYGYQPNSMQQGKDGFGQAFQWDVDLLSGYAYEFVENLAIAPSSSYYKGCDTPNIGERLEEYGATHIVSFGWHLKMYRQALTYAKGNKIPIAVRGDSQLNPLLPWWKKAVKKVYYPFFLKRYNAFLSVGQRNRAYLKQYGVKDEKIIFSPHAVDQTFWKVKGKTETPFTFIWVGKFIELKRPFDVIKAFQEFRKEYPTSRLRMVGSGFLLSDCKRFAEGIEGVEFLGFQNQTELKAVYKDANCLILSSDSETWGLVVNEAFAAGVPAIVSEACGCGPDLINEWTGSIYDVDNVSLLLDSMRKTINKLSTLNTKERVKEEIEKKNAIYSIHKIVESFNFFLNNY